MRPLSLEWKLQLDFVRIRTALSPPQSPSEPAPPTGGAASFAHMYLGCDGIQLVCMLGFVGKTHVIGLVPLVKGGWR